MLTHGLAKGSLMKTTLTKSLKGLGLIWLSLLAASPLNANAPSAKDYQPSLTQQRYAMVLMDKRCDLLAGPARMALQAGYLQARNQEIYQGQAYETIGHNLETARLETLKIDCQAAVVRAETDRVKRAYRLTQNIYHETYAGFGFEWRLDRTNALEDRWRLVQYQSSPAARLGFGLYGPLNAPRFGLMIRFLDPDLSSSSPYSATLIVRDPQKAPSGLIYPPALGLETTMPPGFDELRVQRFGATNRVEKSYPLQYHPRTNEFGVTLERDHVGLQTIDEAIGFEFPTRAYLALAALDPREDMIVELRFQDNVRYVRFRIGDFLVGIAGIYRV